MSTLPPIDITMRAQNLIYRYWELVITIKDPELDRFDYLICILMKYD